MTIVDVKRKEKLLVQVGDTKGIFVYVHPVQFLYLTVYWAVDVTFRSAEASLPFVEPFVPAFWQKQVN